MGDDRDSSPAGLTEDGWARNDQDRLTIGLDATPAERLAWLEEMIRLAYRSGALPRSGDQDPDTPEHP